MERQHITEQPELRKWRRGYILANLSGIAGFWIVVGGITLISLFATDLADGQTPAERTRNLTICLTGKYPILCKRQWLEPDDLQKVDTAERQENLRICLTGKYSVLCRRDKLSPLERERTITAERTENLRICLTGRYKTLCKKNLLSEAELKGTLIAERSENLRTCLTGLYPRLCDRSLLTQEQLSGVTAAERRASETKGARSSRSGSGRASSSGCEAGHWIESVLADGRIIKLEDGSIWEVDAVDTIDSALWLPVSDIVACADKLINTDDNEAVSARRIR